MTIKAVFCFISKKGYLIIKEIIIIPGISFRNLDAPEANTHQTFKRSHYWKEASEQYVLSLTAYHSNLRPPEMASDREYMYFFLQYWWDQTEEAPRDCVSKLPRELLVAGPTYGLVGTWKWHWGGKVREVLIHSIQMSVWRSSDQMSTSDHRLRSLYRICWVLVSFCLEFLFFFISLLHSVYMLAASCSLFLFNDVAYILISSLFLLILCSCACPTLLVSSCALFLPSVYICTFCVCMYLYT